MAPGAGDREPKSTMSGANEWLSNSNRGDPAAAPVPDHDAG